MRNLEIIGIEKRNQNAVTKGFHIGGLATIDNKNRVQFEHMTHPYSGRPYTGGIVEVGFLSFVVVLKEAN